LESQLQNISIKTYLFLLAILFWYLFPVVEMTKALLWTTEDPELWILDRFKPLPK